MRDEEAYVQFVILGFFPTPLHCGIRIADCKSRDLYSAK